MIRVTKAQYGALIELLRPLTWSPGGSASVTPAALAQFTARANRHAKLALRLLWEIPPHADKDPESMAEILTEIGEVMADHAALAEPVDGR